MPYSLGGIKKMKNIYKDLISFELELVDGRLSELPVGTTMVLESLPDIDDEVWPDAYIDRVEENVWAEVHEENGYSSTCYL